MFTKTDVFEEGTRVQVPIPVKKYICAVDVIRGNKVIIFLLSKKQVILKRFVEYYKTLVMVIIRYCQFLSSDTTIFYLLRTLSSYKLQRQKPTVGFT